MWMWFGNLEGAMRMGSFAALLWAETRVAQLRSLPLGTGGMKALERVPLRVKNPVEERIPIMLLILKSGRGERI